jgi:hypothetical protein
MDLIDGPKPRLPENSESFMHRFGKLFILVGVSALAPR